MRANSKGKLPSGGPALSCDIEGRIKFRVITDWEDTATPASVIGGKLFGLQDMIFGEEKWVALTEGGESSPGIADKNAGYTQFRRILSRESSEIISCKFSSMSMSCRFLHNPSICSIPKPILNIDDVYLFIMLNVVLNTR